MAIYREPYPPAYWTPRGTLDVAAVRSTVAAVGWAAMPEFGLHGLHVSSVQFAGGNYFVYIDRAKGCTLTLPIEISWCEVPLRRIREEPDVRAFLGELVGDHLRAIRDKHGPGRVWLIRGCDAVHLVEDDGRAVFYSESSGEVIRLRTIYCHEAAAKREPWHPAAASIGSYRVALKEPAPSDYNGQPIPPDVADAFARMQAKINDRAREPYPSTKHGPGGGGGSGPCDTDCAKCAWEVREQERRAAAKHKPSGMVVTHIDNERGVVTLGAAYDAYKERDAIVRHAFTQEGVRRDPLDAVIDGWKLRDLVAINRERQHEGIHASELLTSNRHVFTAAQRAAVSAHWRAELRAKVKAGEERDKARAVSVCCAIDDYDDV